jgi:solute carrier family 25 (mitochondrial dicarboxylate transporter), member 10
MCTDAVKPAAQRYGYHNCFDGLYRVAKEEGVRVLYRGTTPNVLRSVSMSKSKQTYPSFVSSYLIMSVRPFCTDVSQLAAYDAIKASLISTGHFKDDVQTHLTTGVLAGTLATTVAAPFDVLKSRIQSSQGSKMVRRFERNGECAVMVPLTIAESKK